MAIKVEAIIRKTQGTGASRRLRNAGRVPGVVYGVGEAVAIDMDHNDLFHKVRKEEFHASLLELSIDGKTESVLLRDLQMHPFRQQVQHMDFQRVKKGQKIHINVPLHFLNEEESPAVKLGSGIVSHVMSDIEVSCLPKDIPAFIEVEMGAVEIGGSVHVSDLILPKGAEYLDHSPEFLDAVVATIHAPRAEKVVAEVEEVTTETTAQATDAPTGEEDKK